MGFVGLHVDRFFICLDPVVNVLLCLGPMVMCLGPLIIKWLGIKIRPLWWIYYFGLTNLPVSRRPVNQVDL